MRKPNRISFESLCGASEALVIYIMTLSVLDGHHNRCIAAVLAELKLKIDKKTVGMVKENGYSLKLTQAQQEALLYIRNDLHKSVSVKCENGVFNLLRHSGC